MQLTEISIYPVKSCRGISINATAVDRFGPADDRRWMVVTPDGDMLTQRALPMMALIAVEQTSGGLRLGYRGSQIEVRHPTASTSLCRVRVWDDAVNALDAGVDVAHWLSAHLGCACRLVFMPQDSIRRVDGAYASSGETVGFADGFPLLLIAQASLDELNSRLQDPVPMNRFRPNLVVSDCAPFAEDKWKRVRIGEMEFAVAKACSRCTIPSIIQENGRRDARINRVLASFRRHNGQIFFGQNLLYRQFGQLRVGDPVTVLE
jgi:uncharacterized protein YcbX